MSSQMAYAWKPYVQCVVPATVAGMELERLRKASGGFLRPADVVVAAEPDDAPLHPAFEWNDAVAANAFRADQASYIIRNIVVLNAGEPDEIPMRAFVSVRDEDEGPRYTSMSVALGDEDMREQLLSAAMRDMQAFAQKYSQLGELAGVLRAIGKAQQKMRVAA